MQKIRLKHLLFGHIYASIYKPNSVTVVLLLNVLLGGGVKKEPWATSPQGYWKVKGDVGWQGVGGWSKNWNFGVTSFMDGPFCKFKKCYIEVEMWYNLSIWFLWWISLDTDRTKMDGFRYASTYDCLICPNKNNTNFDNPR